MAALRSNISSVVLYVPKLVLACFCLLQYCNVYNIVLCRMYPIFLPDSGFSLPAILFQRQMVKQFVTYSDSESKTCVFKRASVQIWSALPSRILQVSTLRGEHLQSAHLTLGPTQCVWWLHHKLPLSISSMRGQLCRCCASPEVTNQHMWLPQK